MTLREEYEKGLINFGGMIIELQNNVPEESDMAEYLSDMYEIWEDNCRWIPVGEELPKMYSAVLACNMNGVNSDERDPFIAGYDDSGWFVPWTDKECEVTHWMQKPKLLEKI